MKKTVLLFMAVAALAAAGGYRYYKHRHSAPEEQPALPKTGKPIAIALANGLNSLTISLPSYLQKDNGLDAITLNGRRSGNGASFEWTQESGPEGCIIFNPVCADTRVLKLKAGQYVFKLKIQNDISIADSTTVTVTVKASEKPLPVTVDTIGNPGSNEALEYRNQSNKICYIRAGVYKSFYGSNLSNVWFKVKYRKPGDQVVINSDSYYAFRFSDGFSTNITIDGSGVPGQPYGFKIIGPKTPDAVLCFHDSSRNRTIKNVEIIGGLSANSGGQGIGLQIYPRYSNPGQFDTTDSKIALSRQNGFTMGNDTIINCYIHNCLNEGVYEGPSHYGDKTINHYTGFFPEAQVDSFYFAYNVIDSTGQSGMNVGAVAGRAGIYNNVFTHFALRNQRGHTAGINVNGGSQAYIFGNTFWNALPFTSETQGIAMQGVGGSIINNEFTGCQYSIILLRNTDKNCSLQVPDVYVFNNSMSGTQYGYYVYSAHYATGKIHWKNNIVVGSSDYFGANGKEYFAMDTASNFYGPASSAKFKNFSARDYHLLPGSPLREAGLNLNPYFNTDKNEMPRPAKWSMGAYQ